MDKNRVHDERLFGNADDSRPWYETGKNPDPGLTDPEARGERYERPQGKPFDPVAFQEEYARVLSQHGVVAGHGLGTDPKPPGKPRNTASLVRALADFALTIHGIGRDRADAPNTTPHPWTSVSSEWLKSLSSRLSDLIFDVNHVLDHASLTEDQQGELAEIAFHLAAIRREAEGYRP